MSLFTHPSPLRSIFDHLLAAFITIRFLMTPSLQDVRADLKLSKGGVRSPYYR